MTITENKKSEYFAIHPQILRINSILTFAIYIKTGESAYSKISVPDKTYTALIHAMIFKNNVPALFIRAEEEEHYYDYLEKYIDDIFSDLLISVKSKARIAHELATKLAKLSMEKPTEHVIRRYKKIVSLISDFIYENELSVKYLITMTSSSYHEYNHLINVGIYAMGLLRELVKKEDGHDIHQIAAGFFLHDIGKSIIPRHIAQKNSRLSDEEWALIRRHPQEGLKLLEKLHESSEEIRIIVLQHHERHNGKGYPMGLMGDNIHTYAKICAIADAFDALTSHRPYRHAQSSFNALKTMQKEMN
ncbi:MAG: HD domain-containing protein, partial [Candidatus Latescibacteria bacterium]|nr:HD domain-containing protein [Candidatus Latescibacterota bacterium]